MPDVVINFGPDDAFETLPVDFQYCLQNPSPHCDAVIGSLREKAGICSRPAFASQTYCACVNSALPCPLQTSVACVNSKAYKPAFMQGQDCGPICINKAAVGGEGNIVQGFVQQCGTIQKVTNAFSANPLLLVLLFVMLVAVVFLLASRHQLEKEVESDRHFAPPPHVF